MDGIEAPGGGGDGVSIPKADSYKDKVRWNTIFYILLFYSYSQTVFWNEKFEESKYSILLSCYF